MPKALQLCLSLAEDESSSKARQALAIAAVDAASAAFAFRASRASAASEIAMAVVARGAPTSSYHHVHVLP
ncbi:MAG: hypothetical protein SGPRY_003660 [Prymnesium sp.]